MPLRMADESFYPGKKLSLDSREETQFSSKIVVVVQWGIHFNVSTQQKDRLLVIPSASCRTTFYLQVCRQM